MIAVLQAATDRPSWIPKVLEGWTFLTLQVWQWLGMAMLIATALILGVLLQRVTLWAGRRLTRLTTTKWDDKLVDSGRGPLKLLFFAAILYSGTRLLQLPGPVDHGFEIVGRSLLIVSIAWFVLRFLRHSSSLVGEKLTVEAELRQRGVRTQLTVLRSVVEVAVYVVAVALALMQFEVVRNVGVSLLASAGIAGLVIGLAAQKSIGNLLAGIQLSITQPILIGDTVVLEGEFGTVEEITLTYVVVRIWDLRRLVVPVSYFLDKPFQNWSRTSADMLGTVFVDADYTVDVAAFRAELDRLLATTEGKALWDGKAAGVQVTELGERIVKLRALVSATDAGTLWDLRCLVREGLVAFLAKHPEWAPRTRSQPMEYGTEPSPPLK